MNITQRNRAFDFDNFFNGFYQPSVNAKSHAKNTATNNTFSPRVDVIELAESYQLVAELPGISKENIAVTVDDTILTIEANNKANTSEETQVKTLRTERRIGKFIRSYNLGQDIEQSAIQAEFKDGLLTLTVPKMKEAEVKQHKVEIH
jgi:HSP20 family protein